MFHIYLFKLCNTDICTLSIYLEKMTSISIIGTLWCKVFSSQSYLQNADGKVA